MASVRLRKNGAYAGKLLHLCLRSMAITTGVALGLIFVAFIIAFWGGLFGWPFEALP